MVIKRFLFYLIKNEVNSNFFTYWILKLERNVGETTNGYIDTPRFINRQLFGILIWVL